MLKLKSNVIKINMLILLGVLLLTSIVYSPLLKASFIWDDEEFILGWKSIQNLSSIPNLLTGDLPDGHQGVYRPFRSIAQLVSYQFFQEQPVYYHLQGIVFHLISTSIIFFILSILIKDRSSTIVGTLFFSLHPLQTEAVSFITATFDTLGIVFFLASFLCILLFLHSHLLQTFISRRYQPLIKSVLFLISLFFAFIAFFITELTLSLPVVITIFVFINPKLTVKQKVFVTFPFFLIALVYGIIRFTVLGFWYSYTSDYSLYVQFFTITKIIALYSLRFLFPYVLLGITTIAPGITNVNADTTSIANQSLFDGGTLAGIFIIFIYCISLLIVWRKSKILRFSLLSLFFIFLPVSTIFPSRVLFAERYTYPMFLSVSIIIAYFTRYIITKQRNKNEYILGIITMMYIIVIFLYGFRTFQRTKDYLTPIQYWLSTLKHENSNVYVLNNLGLSFAAIGRFQDALKAFNAASDINPTFVKANFNASRVYVELGKLDQAEKRARLAFQEDTFSKEYAMNYGSILAKMGKGREAQDLLATTAARLKNVDIAYFLGTVSIAMSDYETAEEAFKQALSINNTHTKSYIALGSIFNRTGTPAATIELFDNGKADLSSKRYQADYYYTYAVAAARLDKEEIAKEYVTKAFYANPDDKSIQALWNTLILASESGKTK